MSPTYPPVAAVLTTALLLCGCSEREPDRAPQADAPEITNRLAVTPEVISNLGITFERATRGRLGIWLTVPGQLESPEHRRFLLRAPADGKLVSIAPLWSQVQEGDLLAELVSPELRQAQQELLTATRTGEQSALEARAARERLTEAERQFERARVFAQAAGRRLDDLALLRKQNGALSTKEVVQARETHTRATRGELDAAVARDDLSSRAASRELLFAESEVRVEQHLNELTLLTGLSAEELVRRVDGRPAWQTADLVRIFAPGAGIVVELAASRGETLEHGARLLLLADTRELRFRGHLPEGDLSKLKPDLRVRVVLPTNGMERIETRLIGPLPVADEITRTIRLEAVILNPDGRIPYGISATAEILIQEGQHEEVLIPVHCVVFDGLEAIVFRRDPADPNTVIRTPVELGLRAGELIELLSGVLAGDEIVADGVQQLKRTGLGKAPSGVHFHSDGSWHKEHE